METGKGADALDRRPQLKAALAAAKKLKRHPFNGNTPSPVLFTRRPRPLHERIGYLAVFAERAGCRPRRIP